jgi:hypothetical protein
MKHFPSFCIDNFYPNPDIIREFALSQKFTDSVNGKWPGKRTEELQLLDENLFDAFCSKLLSIFYDYNKAKVSWKIETSFQLIPPFSSIKTDIKNTGWIHSDGVSGIFAGVIYLSKDAELTTGTSIFRLKNTEDLNEILARTVTAKNEFYAKGIDNNYDEELLKHNESFEETIRYNNVYNRLVAWHGEDWHGVNSFHNSMESRLTQVFFVSEITSDSNSPLTRYNINGNYIPNKNKH